LIDEASSLLDATVGTAYFDISSFYDNMDPAALLSEALEMGYPRRILILSVLLDLGPRWLTSGGWTTEKPIIPYCSIVTGEAHGNDKARMVLYNILERAHNRCPRATIHQWVDDLTLKVLGSRRYVRHNLTQVAITLTRDLVDAGYQVSIKSAVVTSIPGLAKEIVDDAKAEGVLTLTAARATVDLGLDVAGGGC
jgi:hypothetical protein